MIDYTSLLVEAMNQGIPLDEVMKNISDAANALEKERKTAESKYDKYNDRVWKSFDSSPNANNAINSIISATRIAPEDMAAVMTHFVCQNVPGYAKAMAKIDMDPIKTYTDMMKSQITAAKVIADNQDKPEDERGVTMFSHLLGEVVGSLTKEHPTEFKITPSSSSLSMWDSINPKLSIADDQKIAEFLKKIGL